MKPVSNGSNQGELFRSRLDQLINLEHPLAILAGQLDWESFDAAFGKLYDASTGRPGLPTRLMVGLHYLKYLHDLSDEAVVCGFIENPYWQYFCGMEFFEHDLPLDSSSMTRWRKRVGREGAEALLKETISTAVREGALKSKRLEDLNVDTTVEEKNIAYPTDARLYLKAQTVLVKAAKARGLSLRQTYKRLAKRTYVKACRYAHARQMNRSRACWRKLRTYLRRTISDIQRKAETLDPELQVLLDRAQRIHDQTRKDTNKLYSFHAPEVECIAKGKAHKKYEFGVKASYATTNADGWIVGAMTLPGKPYDGHTLEQALQQVQALTGTMPKRAYCDKGYRGAKLTEPLDCEILLSGSSRGRSRSLQRKLKRRNAIEPAIGHLKLDHRLNLCRLKDELGDAMNAILSAAGFNLKKLLRAFLRLFKILNALLKITPRHNPQQNPTQLMTA